MRSTQGYSLQHYLKWLKKKRGGGMESNYLLVGERTDKSMTTCTGVEMTEWSLQYDK